MARRPTVLLFDVDGTLISCGGAGREAMEAAFRETIGAPEIPRFSFAGNTDQAIARRFWTEAGYEASAARIEALLSSYLGHLPGALARSEAYVVFDGVVALLDRLAALEGFALGLGTGNLEDGAYAKLRHGGLDARFAFGGFGSDHEARAELIRAGAERGAARLGRPRADCRVVVLGDTERDVQAAHAIGAECVGVATGPLDVDALRAAGADAAFDGLHHPGVLGHLMG